jgi:hypothetical protein
MDVPGKESKTDHAPNDPVLCLSDGIGGPAGSSPSLAYWSSMTEGRPGLNPEVAALMMAQPGFADACRMAFKLSVARHGRNKLLTRVTVDISRLIYGYLVIYLEARGGITLTAIQELCHEIGLASAGRAQAILFHLRATGYVRPDPANTDRRSRRYLPSAEMKENLREVMADELRAFSLIEPQAGVAADRLVEPDFFRAFMIRLGEGFAAGLKNRPARVISHFAERNAGLIILWDILLSAQEGDSYPPRGLLKMSVTELAQKYDVSRSHVFRLLRDAEILGLLKRNADEQTGAIEDVLADDVAEFQVTTFLGLAVCCHHAFQSDSNMRLPARAEPL